MRASNRAADGGANGVSQQGYSLHDLSAIPDDLPVPVDDGAAAHLAGMRIPSVPLPATDGTTVDLSAIPGTVVVFAYPRTGRPGEPPFVPEWDAIPGARGCTPHTCGYRDLDAEFAALGARVFGLSTQDTAYQQEMVERLGVPFPVLSDEHLALAHALRLPTMDVGGVTLLKRIAWIARTGTIERVFYPVFPPDRNAADVLAALRP
ncbi:MAG TPA: peroxiredoxin [Candidatus Baltobacteraceae bacterium]|nr:peroxiredoxin [Candidatus Baltobacteraceae bacterium]